MTARSLALRLAIGRHQPIVTFGGSQQSSMVNELHARVCVERERKREREKESAGGECVFVCVNEREGEREGETHRQREKEQKRERKRERGCAGSIVSERTLIKS